MKVLYKEFTGDHIYLLPISDTQIGSKNADLKLLQGYIDWVQETPNAYVWLNGDIANVATTVVGSSPITDDDLHVQDQINTAVKIFSPIKDKILGGITGNHEMRTEKLMGWNSMMTICQLLEIPYCGYSAILHLKLYNGQNKRDHKEKGESVDYIIYAHHTTGGGATVGSKLNRVDQLRQIVPNADIYLGSHNHLLGVVSVVSTQYSPRAKRIEELRQTLVDTGSYEKWDGGYAEAFQMVPVKLGSARIRLNGLKKDVHVSI